MLSLTAKIRKNLGRKANLLRKKGKLPAVLYGYKIKSIPLEVDYKDFEKVFREGGETSLISLKIEGEKKTYHVLVHDIQRDPLSGKFIHVDFYQPSLTEKTEASIPLKFVGEAEAVKNLGATLVKNISELEVRALPQDLPHEIEVDISKLKTLDDHIKISDLKLPKEIEILRDPEEVIVSVVPPEREEEIEEVSEEVKEEESKKPEEKEEEKEQEQSEKQQEK
ncbi:50S ribosomal protein L25/general stress protein Ctc [bacterium]|nr:50S ribosomal protein L25/general stress protein Ctc [bacterium]